MKILQIRFKNLNSLVGEWQIDLTHPAFTTDGIFAITGPTGAGKSTILDAMCLALYGRTPRLNRVNKSSNEIMSRQTGECFAEVVFESQAGRFRCHWSQRKAYRRAGGELQAPEREIACAKTGKIFESRLNEVAKKIVAVTGMDFERFTRSMLLAQGGFAAFLQAAADERAPILEQITGTEIYSVISERVHRRQRAEQERLGLLRAETAGIKVLEPEQEAEIGRSLEERQREERELGVGVERVREAIVWLGAIDKLKREIESLVVERGRLQGDLEAFAPERERLGLALRAGSLDGVYAGVVAVRKRQAGDRGMLRGREEGLPGIEVAVSELAEGLKGAEERSRKAKAGLREAAPVLVKVRALDQRIGDQKKTVVEDEGWCKREGERVEALRKARLAEDEKRSMAGEALASVSGYLEEHMRDEWLVGGLAGVEEQLSGLLGRQKEISQKEGVERVASQALEVATRELKKGKAQVAIRKQEAEAGKRQIEQIKEELERLLAGRLLREYRAEKESLLREMALLQRIASLKEERVRLEDGKACPLCGSIEHPYAAGNIPVADESERRLDELGGLIIRAEELEAEIGELEAGVALAGSRVGEAEKVELGASGERKVAESRLEEVRGDLARLRSELGERRQEVVVRLQPLGIVQVAEGEIPALLELLRGRLRGWQDQVSRKVELEGRLAGIESEQRRLDAVIESCGSTLAEKVKGVEGLRQELADVVEERRVLYGEKSADAEEELLNRAVADAEEVEKSIREKHVEVQQRWSNAKSEIEGLKGRIEQQAAELVVLEGEFAAAVVAGGFADEQEFMGAVLPVEVRDELAAKAKALDERQTELGARERDRRERLEMEVSRKVSESTLEELEPELKEQEERLKELREMIVGFRHKLSDNARAREMIREKQEAIEAQERECVRWDNLHALIGSADGKKYRNFAQGLTFELMVGYANRQLQKMSDRYLLVRDIGQPLELNVVDNYQAGEVRSTKNLSGGESFIVSLALALGLSQMASQNVRVDSLFLDEGFGTLDDEALDTALETLAGLQQGGKLIGVISHVLALKERISAQIQVTPKIGGKSQLSGPGCSGMDRGDRGQGDDFDFDGE